MASIYVLNETGARVWELVDVRRSLADITDILRQEYDVEAERLVIAQSSYLQE
jgi:hypothetical protein